MAVICPRCGRQYDATLFQFHNRVECECGRIIEAPGHTLEVEGMPSESLPPPFEAPAPRKKPGPGDGKPGPGRNGSGRGG